MSAAPIAPWRIQVGAIARFELAEVLRSRWLWFCLATYVVVGAVMVGVGLRESTIMGFTGTNRVLLSFAHALLLVLPLLALLAMAPAIHRAREDGTLELLFAQPLAPSAWFIATTAVRSAVLIVPLAVVLAGLGIWGQIAYDHRIPWAFLLQAFVVSAALLWAFVGLGTAISVSVRNAARIITYVVLLWALGVALLDFGLIAVLLKWRVNPQAVFVLAAINPVESARLALLAGLEPDLAAFGPVGFYLANRVGPGQLLGLGIAWPLLVGFASWAWALQRFVRSDRI